MNQTPDDDRVDPTHPKFREAVAAVAAEYFGEAAIKTRRTVADELEAAGWESAARWLRKRTGEIQASQRERSQS